jgi:transcriptional regulator with XRE-family HTH domain
MEKSIHSAQYAILLGLLRETRINAGVTQEELAKLVGETQSFISKCERGERRLDAIELRSFCNALNTGLGDFIESLELRLRSTNTKAGSNRRVSERR